ncbi:MAG: adenine phosphoribosyltransferase [Firmicutes bacterium]|nr:adenine phosphoribosyltransferase [Bacillota bacterium]MCL1953495.1 adenine phosphoribosyltransferase [Bacillota bacterium]
MNNKEYYKVDIAGWVEYLPLLTIADFKIAFFNLHGHVGLTEHCASAMVDMVQGVDVLLTVESKGLQLTHVLARNLGHDRYGAARKVHKLYMQDGVSTEYRSITTDSIQRLYLSREDADLIKGKKVALVDDVVSTGGSLAALEQLALDAGAIVATRCCVMAEGDAVSRTDISYLASIPITKV